MALLSGKGSVRFAWRCYVQTPSLPLVLACLLLAGCALPPAGGALETKKDSRDTVAPAEALAKVEAMAIEAAVEPLPNRCQPVPLGTETEVVLKALRDSGTTDHLPYLVEYGLCIHWKMLEQTCLARELPVESNLALAELVRLAGIPRYRTAHEGGWLNCQFYGPFTGTGWSSFQIYLWVKEHHGVVLDYPNGDRISSLLERIEASGMSSIGGGNVCHYGCQ